MYWMEREELLSGVGVQPGQPRLNATLHSNKKLALLVCDPTA
jgi:hypothetical protein